MSDHLQAVIGDDKNFWLYSSRNGFDLTHPSEPGAPPSVPSVHIQTTAQPVTIDPAKSALVIIDMQNFFLSPALGRNLDGAGHKALHQLKDHAIPAARQAGMRVIWLNWGLTQDEIDSMPPAIKRAFGFEAVPEHGSDNGVAVDRHGQPKPPEKTVVQDSGKDAKVYKGLGSDCGTVIDPHTGQRFKAGRLLMRDQWNSALCPPLDQIFEEGRSLASCPDVWIHKNRMSGLWGAGTDLQQYLEQKGLRTLIFAGVNTDQCVSGTLTDAFSRGYDCILLSDGSGTTSPDYAQQCIEFNSGRTYGFVTTCKQLAEGVAAAFAA